MPTMPLPQLSDEIFLTDGGIETTLLFDDHLDLPDFAAFDLLRSASGRAALERYFRTYADLAQAQGVGIVLETPTWRASADWGARLGYAPDALAAANRDAVALVAAVAGDRSPHGPPVVVSGCVGPRGDGYDPGQAMSVEEARTYHAMQIRSLVEGGADMIGAITMTNAAEAIGVTRAAVDVGVPVAISFTVETDGSLPTRQSLRAAIEEVDAATDAAPAYYQLNCAHPTHFEHALEAGSAWTARIRGLRANASKMSHDELDEAEELDRGDPVELAADYQRLRAAHPQLTVLGGCCGTDHRHVGAIGRACATATL